MAARSKDPRPTLTAFGAPLFFSARRDMGLEEAVVRSLRVLRRDPTVLLSLPVVLVKNERTLDGGEMLAKAKKLRLEAELGMVLDLTAELSRRYTSRALGRRLTVPSTAPRYPHRRRVELRSARRGREHATCGRPLGLPHEHAGVVLPTVPRQAPWLAGPSRGPAGTTDKLRFVNRTREVHCESPDLLT